MNKAPWSSLKRAFWKKMERQDRMICFYCAMSVSREVPPGNANRATIDHAIPLSKGGKHSVKNFIVSCEPCNLAKADK